MSFHEGTPNGAELRGRSGSDQSVPFPNAIDLHNVIGFNFRMPKVSVKTAKGGGQQQGIASSIGTRPVGKVRKDKQMFKRRKYAMQSIYRNGCLYILFLCNLIFDVSNIVKKNSPTDIIPNMLHDI